MLNRHDEVTAWLECGRFDVEYVWQSYIVINRNLLTQTDRSHPRPTDTPKVEFNQAVLVNP